MKKINLLAVALAAFTMFSCSNEEIADLGSNAPGEKATLTIKVEGAGNNVAQSRAIGATTSDVTINNYIVFLFREGGALDCPPFYSSTGGAVTINNGSTAAKTAYVVANVGRLANSPFAGVTTEAELKAVAGDLMTNNNTSTQTRDNLWMSGTNNVSFNGTNGSVTVSLDFVAAKIELVVKDNRSNLTGGSGDITIADEKVVLLYAGKSGKFFGTTDEKVAQTAFYSGDVSYPGLNTGNVTASTALADVVSAAFTANTGGAVFNHFYTFGNNGATQPTILAIQSKRTVGNDTKTIYYPIQFSADDAGYTIEPGNRYIVTLTLRGDVNAGEGSGTSDPEQSLITSSIGITVTAASWTPVTVDKTFN